MNLKTNYHPIDQGIIKKLKGICGKEFVKTAMEDLILYSYDATRLRYKPEAVLFPATPMEISEILKLANEKVFPVTARGGGVGFTGGALPVCGGVVLSLQRLNRILDIDAINHTALVEAGVTTERFRLNVAEKGLFYPVNPSSMGTSTIGGNIATGASGPSALKYGTTKDYVLVLEAVLPSGEIVQLGSGTRKSAVGYELATLLVGSEGTLAVITKAKMRLLRQPQASRAALLGFKDLDKAVNAGLEMFKTSVIPSALELMDDLAIYALREFQGRSLPAGITSGLMIEVDGNEDTVEKEIDMLLQVAGKYSPLYSRRSFQGADYDDIIELRRAVSPATSRLAPRKLNEDIVVPTSKVLDYISKIKQLSRKYEIPIVCHGHLGDGNIHTDIMIDDKDPKQVRSAEEILQAMFSFVVELGGSISAEHGIGITKAPYLHLQLSPEVLALSRRIKDAFDPNYILNPGKIFHAIQDAS